MKWWQIGIRSVNLEPLLQDARYALRQLWRAPGFSIVALMTLAIGIGSTTAIFTLVYDVMLHPLPFAHPDRLVTVEEKVAEWSNLYPTLPVSANHFTFWQQHSRTVDSMAIMQQYSIPLGAGDQPSQVEALSTTPEIFSVLQVQPELGRSFTTEEAQRGHEHVAIVTYDLWRDQLGGDRGILRKTISLDGAPYSVIGVMPRSFHMPSIHTLDTIANSRQAAAIAVLVPLTFSKERLAEQMGDLNYFGLARLKTGITVTAANAELNALQHTISTNLPADEKATLAAVLTPFQEKLIGNNRKPMMILLIAVLGLLLVGCVNVTNLLLSRAVGQRRQMAVAAALGASRAELVRMAIRETVVIAVLGGALGVLLAAGIVPSMQQYLPAALNFRGPLHLDWAGVGCALLLATLATLTAGAAPALMVSRTASQEVLQSDARLAGESQASRRARRVLITVEATVSVALVLITGLLATSLIKLMAVDRGFTSERTITATVQLPSETYRDDQHRAAFYREILERLNGLPGVEHAGFSSVLPLTGGGWGDLPRVAGDSRPFTHLPLANFRSVSSQYFVALHIRLIAGETFSESDWGKNLALVSQKTARSLWPGKDPLGRQFSRGDPATEKPFTVVGVVADARTISLAEEDPMLIYVPY